MLFNVFAACAKLSGGPPAPDIRFVQLQQTNQRQVSSSFLPLSAQSTAIYFLQVTSCRNFMSTGPPSFQSPALCPAGVSVENRSINAFFVLLAPRDALSNRLLGPRVTSLVYSAKRGRLLRKYSPRMSHNPPNVNKSVKSCVEKWKKKQKAFRLARFKGAF